ncbi:hypothetical protein GOODEAATRI_031367 [Goodea atripinnis]|uniref:FERM central domain-containing protein n=1 Tax=Goodea atripinnis TaxID=208336 RepID=A0ABV0N5S6_9TELE
MLKSPLTGVCGVRGQFYLQLRHDIGRGALPCPAHLKAHLLALMLQADQGDQCEDNTSGDKQDVQLICRTMNGVSCRQAQNHFLFLCSSLQMYGIILFAACGENHSEYFLGPTPVGVVIFKNKVLEERYFCLEPRRGYRHLKRIILEKKIPRGL